MSSTIGSALLLAALAWAAGCGEKTPREQEEGMPGMEGMQGTPGMTGMPMKMPSMDMMPSMRAHMDSLAGASPSRVIDMLAGHDSIVLRMLDAMGSDMRGMSMAADPAWSALADSIRKDLEEIPNLSGEDLIFRTRLHAARMRRLMKRHEQMMSGMGTYAAGLARAAERDHGFDPV